MLPCKGVQSESKRIYPGGGAERIYYILLYDIVCNANLKFWNLRLEYQICEYCTDSIVQVLFHLSHSFLHYIFATPLGEQGHVRLILPVFRIGTRLQTG